MSDAERVNIEALHQALIDNLVERDLINRPSIEAAFRAIPRHLFLPDTPLEAVYKDDAIPTKKDDHGRAISSSSQPAMMAIMLEQLDIQPGDHVLEVGAGTGYNAALMSYLVGEHGRVTTIDIDQDIVNAAQTHLQNAGCTNVTVICGDGMNGFAAHAPYNRIILTVGGWEIAPAWREQLNPDGRLLLPLSLKGPQFSIAFAKQNGHLTSHSVHGCGFMRLHGPNAGPDQSIPIDPESNILLGYEDNFDEPRRINKESIHRWLTTHYHDQALDIHLLPRQAWRSLMFWLAIHEPNLIDISVRGEMAHNEAAPFLFGRDGESPWRMSIGALEEDNLAVYVRPADDQLQPDDPMATFELGVRGYGVGNTAVHKLISHAQNWQAAGRPNAEAMQVDVYPVDTPIAAETAVRRRWHTFVITFNEATKRTYE